MHSLPIFLRLAGEPVILIGQGPAADAKRRLLDRAGAVIVDENANARIAFVAVENGAVDISARLKSRGILVNVADQPDLCDFTLPSILDRNPVLIAVGTGGASAGLAKAIRQRLEEMLPPSLGALATALGEARARLRVRWPGAAERRRAIDQALAANGPLDPMKGFALDQLENWLAAPGKAAPTGLIRFLITSDDPDQLTLEQARALGMADTLIHSPNIAPAILSRARADAVRIATDSVKHPLHLGLTVQLVRGFPA